MYLLSSYLYNNKKPEAICNEYAYCSQTPNCHFKQLARKIQECEELKEEIKSLEKINHRNDQELLRRLTYASNAERQRDRYRSALEEIEAATKINCEEICGRKFTDCNDNSCFSVNILDIINKAKGR